MSGLVARLQFVSVLPTGTPAPEAALGYCHVAAHAISSDGSRVIWTNSEENRGHLYMRDTLTGQTIQLDAAQGVPEPESAAAQFQTASSDGSRVFFTDKQRLTADSTAEPEQGTGKPDLYECEMAEEGGKLACKLRDLTVDHNAGEHAAVQGFVLGASEDGIDRRTSSPKGCSRATKTATAKRPKRARTTCTSFTTTARTGRPRSSPDSQAKTSPSGKAAEHGEHRLPDGARLAERTISGVHVGGEPDRV